MYFRCVFTLATFQPTLWRLCRDLGSLIIMMSWHPLRDDIAERLPVSLSNDNDDKSYGSLEQTTQLVWSLYLPLKPSSPVGVWPSCRFHFDLSVCRIQWTSAEFCTVELREWSEVSGWDFQIVTQTWIKYLNITTKTPYLIDEVKRSLTRAAAWVSLAVQKTYAQKVATTKTASRGWKILASRPHTRISSMNVGTKVKQTALNTIATLLVPTKQTLSGYED